MPITLDPIDPLEKLYDAVNSNDRKMVRRLIEDLVAYVNCSSNSYDEGKAASVLYILRRRRLFEEMRQAADAFLSNGCSTFKIRKYYAQALIDMGFLAAAEDVLMRLRSDADNVRLDPAKELKERNDAENQWAEACGLLGRAYKDRYVNAKAPDVNRIQTALNLAITHYYDCYTSNEQQRVKRHWHGINAVAAARLAKKQKILVIKQFDVLGTAETILEEVAQARIASDGPLDIWATANAMEASIALNKWDEAYKWAKEYVEPNREKVDAFEIASTLRQLKDVWELNVEEEPGSLLIPLLRTRLQDLEGFKIEVEATEPISAEFLKKQANSLEKKFGGAFLSFRQYYNGVSRARAVARIGPSADEHFGTGFLIKGEELLDDLAGQKLLITCSHVVSNEDLRALRPNRAVITFRPDDNIQKFGAEKVLWEKPEGDLDVSILHLDQDTADLPTIPLAPAMPEEKRVLIFGHAEGGTLSFSLGDNRLVDQNEFFLQYRAPTVGGNSGSPVFNKDWELVAVHHRGGYSMPRLSDEGVHEANQGSSIFAIKEAVRKDPQQLLT